MKQTQLIQLLLIVLIGLCLYALYANPAEGFADDAVKPAPQPPQTPEEKRREERLAKEKEIADSVTKSVASEAETKCMDRAKAKPECKALSDQLEKAPENQRMKLYQQYQTCTGDEYNKCACENKEAIRQSCYDRMKNQKPGAVRSVGCFLPGMKDEELTKCLADPVGYLCAGTKANSQQCEDTKNLCPNPCDAMEDLTKPPEPI